MTGRHWLGEDWENTNRLLGTEGYDGIKTGTTVSAGCCLVASGHRGKAHLLSVVLEAKEGEACYTDTRALFEWAWEQRGIAPRTDAFARPVTNHPLIRPSDRSIYRAVGISPRLSYQIEKRPFYVTRDGLGQSILDLFA